MVFSLETQLGFSIFTMIGRSSSLTMPMAVDLSLALNICQRHIHEEVKVAIESSHVSDGCPK